MEHSTIYKILVSHEARTTTQYIQGIGTFLREAYGDQLEELQAKLAVSLTDSQHKLVFLMTLNREPVLQNYLCAEEPLISPKHRVFFNTLGHLTETFLDHLLSKEEYIEQSTKMWLIS